MAAIDVRPGKVPLLAAEADSCEWVREADTEMCVPLAKPFDPVAALADVAELISKSHSPTSS